MIVAFAMAGVGVLLIALGDLGHFFRLQEHVHTAGLGDPAHQLSFLGSLLVMWAAVRGLVEYGSNRGLSSRMAVFVGTMGVVMLSLGFLGMSVRPDEGPHHLLHIAIGLTSVATLVYGKTQAARGMLLLLSLIYGSLVLVGLRFGELSPGFPLSAQANLFHAFVCLTALLVWFAGRKELRHR